MDAGGRAGDARGESGGANERGSATGAVWRVSRTCCVRSVWQGTKLSRVSRYSLQKRWLRLRHGCLCGRGCHWLCGAERSGGGASVRRRTGAGCGCWRLAEALRSGGVVRHVLSNQGRRPARHHSQRGANSAALSTLSGVASAATEVAADLSHAEPYALAAAIAVRCAERIAAQPPALAGQARRPLHAATAAAEQPTPLECNA